MTEVSYKGRSGDAASRAGMDSSGTGSGNVARLAGMLEGAPAQAILAEALSGRYGPVAVVSSFGADSAVLLHLVARIAPATPVLYADPGRLFPETHAYRRTLAARLGLTDVRPVRPPAGFRARRDPNGDLWQADPDLCCQLFKSEPLEAALAPLSVVINGRKRFQTADRAAMPVVDLDRGRRLRLSPLAAWTPAELRAHMARYRLPEHPMAARGYPSIGCVPCTGPVGPDEHPRAGRWRGRAKEECGIHFDNGRPMRG
jgi:phosphoadenosine phosphosulfate reductase